MTENAEYSQDRLLTEEERAAVLEHVNEFGDMAAAGAIGVSRQTLARAAAGFPIRRGSLALIRNAVAFWRS